MDFFSPSDAISHIRLCKSHTCNHRSTLFSGATAYIVRFGSNPNSFLFHIPFATDIRQRSSTNANAIGHRRQEETLENPATFSHFKSVFLLGNPTLKYIFNNRLLGIQRTRTRKHHRVWKLTSSLFLPEHTCKNFDDEYSNKLILYY